MTKKKINPWKVCNAKLGKGRDPERFERCVKGVKKSAPKRITKK